MTTRTETQARPEPTASEEHNVDSQSVDSLGNFGLVHLAACLGVAGAVLLATNLLEWLK